MRAAKLVTATVVATGGFFSGLLGVSGPAQAEAGPPVAVPAAGDLTRGGGVSQPGTIPLADTAMDVAEAKDKGALADEYYHVMFGGGTDDAHLRALAQAFRSKYGVDALDVARLPVTVAPGSSNPALAASVNSVRRSLAASVQLSVTQFPQLKSYYCGPASGQTILNYSGPSKSKYNGATLSQANLASAAHMATDQNGGTSWASGLFRVGVNRWQTGTSSGFYVDASRPTASQFISYLTTDIGNKSRPFGVDAVEMANRDHYNGHPRDQTIGHWLAAYGYSGSGSTVYFTDPATSVFPAAAPKFSYNSTTFTNTYLQSNGVTW